jgi:hypothetical protein
VKRWVGVLLTVIVLVVVAGVIVFAGGDYATYPREKLTGSSSSDAPSWTRPCVGLRPLRTRWTECGRTTGRVLWKPKSDSDVGDQRHLLLAAHFHVRIVKPDPQRPQVELPGLGAKVTVVGPVIRTKSGKKQILAVRVTD